MSVFASRMILRASGGAPLNNPSGGVGQGYHRRRHSTSPPSAQPTSSPSSSERWASSDRVAAPRQIQADHTHGASASGPTGSQTAGALIDRPRVRCPPRRGQSRRTLRPRARAWHGCSRRFSARAPRWPTRGPERRRAQARSPAPTRHRRRRQGRKQRVGRSRGRRACPPRVAGLHFFVRRRDDHAEMSQLPGEGKHCARLASRAPSTRPGRRKPAASLHTKKGRNGYLEGGHHGGIPCRARSVNIAQNPCPWPVFF